MSYFGTRQTNNQTYNATGALTQLYVEHWQFCPFYCRSCQLQNQITKPDEKICTQKEISSHSVEPSEWLQEWT